MAVERLDDVESDLVISVERMVGGADSFMYAFSVSADDITLLSGRAAVRLMES